MEKNSSVSKIVRRSREEESLAGQGPRIGCLVMAGGSASRMGGLVKPLLTICGQSLLERTLAGIGRLCSRILVAYSPYTRMVAEVLQSRRGVAVLETSGISYSDDLHLALSKTALPVLVSPADLVWVDTVALEDFVEKALAVRAGVVNLVDPLQGLTGISVVKELGFSHWADIVSKEGVVRDIDTWNDYLEEVKKCGSMEASRPEKEC